MPFARIRREGSRPAPRRTSRRGPVALVAPVLGALLAATLVLAGCTSSTGTDAQATKADDSASYLDLGQGWSWQKQPTSTELGVTHTQDSLDPNEPDAARARGEDILRNDGAIWQNIHLMGFGTVNPEPAEGEFDWASLDTRMKLVEDTGDRTALTLCCSPDWMKGGAQGETDWSKLERAPMPEYFDAFAKLSAEAVQRYPQVERVLVWNELKGFYHEDQNRWDYEGYTELYNKVYTAVKAVRPDVQVGGPYPVMTSLAADDHNATTEVTGTWGALDERPMDVIDYWLQHNVGADFLTVDASTSIRSGDAVDPVSVGAEKLAAIDTWLRGKTELPIWWAEFYSDVPPGVVGGPESQASAASALASVAAFAKSGAAAALLWGPQGHSLEYSALWTDSTKDDGGQPTPLTRAWQWLVPRLAEGNVEIGSSQTSPLIGFRAPDGSALIVNVSSQPVPVPGHDALEGWTIAERSGATAGS
ncbi:MAG TPA: hypothetical protein VGO23_06585 [Pseudonocardia sp.]|nr:hypothetical protein [Pseudonocardia sp.]